MKLNLTDPYGIVALSDVENRALIDAQDEHQRQTTLPEAAKNGEVFCIDREDPIEDLGVELVTDFPSEPGYSLRFSPLGGNFLLHAPTGKLVLSGLAAWAANSEAVEEFEVPPGAYTVIVHSSEEFHTEHYDEDMSRLVGAESWKYRNKVDHLYFIGCLPTILAIGVLIFATLAVGIYFVALAAVLWVPYSIARLSKRYKTIEKAINTYESQLPLFVLQLNRIEETSGLVGGYVR